VHQKSHLAVQGVAIGGQRNIHCRLIGYNVGWPKSLRTKHL